MTEPLPFYAVGPTPADACADCGRPLKGQGAPDPFGYLICPACLATYTEPPVMTLGRPGALAAILAAVARRLG
jgi:hypothetical protein